MRPVFDSLRRKNDLAPVRPIEAIARSHRASALRRTRRISVEVLEDRQLLATITVNTAADSTTVGSTLSLRQALEISDGTLAVSALSAQEQAQVSGAVGTSNTINFNIPTTDPGYDAATGVWTIAVNSALPTINTNAAIINGYSQPGAFTNTLEQGDNAKIVIAIDGAGQGTINGLVIAQPGSQVFGLDIGNFLGDGVVIAAAGNVQVAGNFIGTDPTGETAAPNGNGVVIENSSNLIGGPSAANRNVISGNSGDGYGVYVPDQAENPLNIASAGNVIENNDIGLDATGTKGFGTAQSAGVYDASSGDTYGGTAVGVGNVISGNHAGGIKSSGSITIEGNYIGTDATGNVAVGNGGAGFGITSSGAGNAAIMATISYNLVSGNLQSGIAVSPGSQNLSMYTIANNLIGTNATGTAALGNSATGLQLASVENATVLDNVISGNQVGVTISGFGTDVEDNVFQGNFIGSDKTGQVALGNTDMGMSLSAAFGNEIGGTGTGDGNVIAFNGGFGIEVSGGDQDQITQNSIHDNASAGIKLVLGGNGVATAPVMTFTPGAGGSGTLSGTLTSAANVTYVVEIFSNPTVPAIGQEQGQTFIQDVTVNTNGSGTGTFSLTLPNGDYTATATDPNGNTSAFSAAVESQPSTASSTVVSSSMNPSIVGQEVIFTAVVTAPGYAGTPAGTVTFSIDGQAQAPITLSLVGGVDEAQVFTSALTVDQHTVTADYSGDANVSPSSGALPVQVVNSTALQPSSTTLTSSPDPSPVGQQVTFTAVVSAAASAGTPTGTVTFTIDGVSQTATSVQLESGIDEATFSISTLAAGNHTIAASYNGDSSFNPSAAPVAVIQTVNRLTTTTSVVSSANPSTVGQPETFIATVAPGGPAAMPSGTVTFSVDGTQEPPVSLILVHGSDQAVFTIANLTAGSHSITATYDGDPTFAPSSAGASVTETALPPGAAAVPPAGTAVSATADTAPEVMRVERFGYHMHPTYLVLFFNEALDPSRAQDPSNYSIISPSGHRIGIKNAFYNPTTQTVTLSPNQLVDFHHSYRLIVNGEGSSGLDDRDGTPLDGSDNGDPGSDYVATLNWRNVVFTAPGKGLQLPGIYAASSTVPQGPLVHRTPARRRAPGHTAAQGRNAGGLGATA
jgi:hypothetical protein